MTLYNTVWILNDSEPDFPGNPVMPENLLILHPRDAHAVPADPDGLLQRLTELGFVGAPFDFHGRRHLQPGEEFLYLLSFLGCSPVVSLGSPGATGDDFCHIEPGIPSTAPQLLYGANAKQPRCPQCGHRLEHWQQQLEQWRQDPETTWTCPQCGAQQVLERLKWRQSAGLARYFLTVWGIFEGEAVPNEQLMGSLEQYTGLRWSYFYLRR